MIERIVEPSVTIKDDGWWWLITVGDEWLGSSAVIKALVDCLLATPLNQPQPTIIYITIWRSIYQPHINPHMFHGLKPSKFWLSTAGSTATPRRVSSPWRGWARWGGGHFLAEDRARAHQVAQRSSAAGDHPRLHHGTKWWLLNHG